MNILIPHHWLLEHLDTDARPTEIQKYLSLSGPSVERLGKCEGDTIYDIEVTTNRVDAMSVRGIAREAAVILKQFGKKARLKPLHIAEISTLQPKGEPLPLPIVFSTARLNKRTLFVVLKGVQRTPTPEWMATRLRQVGMNIHDAAIDITNYVTHELGHPCHAFDYDKLMITGGEIHIVEAKKGESFTTLDGEQFTTVGGEVVFKNGRGEIIDLPSIKGTQNTSIDESTQNVLLLIESILPEKVRFASMTHAIRTVAAQLMEKNADPHLGPLVLAEGIRLYQELCHAQIGSQVFDRFPGKTTPKTLTLSVAEIDRYLGIALPVATLTEILTDLGCQVVAAAKPARQTKLKITPPSFRPDLTIVADIVEEIARIYGYHRLPSSLMATPIPLTKQAGVNFTLENKIKHFLADIGWQELYTYSLVSESIARQSGVPLTNHLKLANPLTEDRVYLRRSLLPSLVEVIAQNPTRKELSVFELAALYEPGSGSKLPLETMHLGLVSTREYRAVRGDLEALLSHLYVNQLQVVPTAASPQFSQQAELRAQTTDKKIIRIGKIGLLKSGQIGVGLAMASLLQVVRMHPTYKPIPKTMPIIEDLTLTIPATVTVGQVIHEINRSDALVNSVILSKVYGRNFTFTIQYHHPEKSLTTLDIAVVRQKIVTTLAKKLRVTLVGELHTTS